MDFPNQFAVLDNHHLDDSDSIIVGNDGFPNIPFGFSKKLFMKYLDLESNLVRVDVLMETSSSPYYPFCSTFCNALSCDEDTPCSPSSSSNELDFELTQASGIIHD